MRAVHSMLMQVFCSVFLLGCASSSQEASNHVAVPLAAQSPFYCDNAGAYRGKVVGKGHCVSLIKQCSGAPTTHNWREGEKVRGRSLEPGTIIATFRNGRYPNKTGWHAAIYISQDSQGIWVWDQWVGKPVHKRLIRFKNGKGTPNNDGSAYSIVRFVQ